MSLDAQQESPPTPTPSVDVRLDETWASRVVGGIPSIELAESVLADAPEAAGALVRWLNPVDRAIGYGIIDPSNGVVWNWPAVADEPLDRGFFVRRVRRAFRLRKRAGLVRDESAFRLINGEGDGLPGIWVDVYARHVVIYSFSKELDAWTTELAGAILGELGPQSLIAKVRPPRETPVGRVPFRSLSAEPPPARIEVSENDMRFECHLTGGINTGLFCDLRELRTDLARMARGRTVLNAFCYTSSLSVACALAGAERVVSVDYAAGVLEWSKSNFRLNGLDPGDHRWSFVRADVFDFLKEARRHGPTFDLVILDPPASTAVPGRRWHMKSDYDRLIGHALRALDAEGWLVVAASSFLSRPEKLESQIRAAAKEHDRRLRLLKSYSLPPDYPTQMIHPQNRYLKCYLLAAE